jgi:ATP-dependent RNA helicase DDX3X
VCADDSNVRKSGRDIPAPISSFNNEGFPLAIRNSARMCGYRYATAIQRHAVPVGMARRDLLAYAPPASGKTAALCVPVASQAMAWMEERERVKGQLAPMAVMIGETAQRCSMVFDELNKFIANTGIRAVLASNRSPVDDDIELGCEIIVSTPWLLVRLIENGCVDLKLVRAILNEKVPPSFHVVAFGVQRQSSCRWLF